MTQLMSVVLAPKQVVVSKVTSGTGPLTKDGSLNGAFKLLERMLIGLDRSCFGHFFNSLVVQAVHFHA